MDENKWTKANRITEVIQHEIRKEVVGKDLGPSLKSLAFYGGALSKLKDGDPVWCVWATTRTGLDKENTGLTYFATESEAKDSVLSLPVGSKFGDRPSFPIRLQEFLNGFSGDTSSGLKKMFGAGDPDDVHGHLYDALIGAGVLDESTFGTSNHVLEWVGEDSVAWMQTEFGENWSAVADFEYCLHHFPTSSLASLASRIFLATFVTYDDFVVGYLTKQFEAIYGGTEKAAIKIVEIQKKAGAAGGEASRERKLVYLENVMQEIESLKTAASLISEDRVVSQAFESSLRKFPGMPKSAKTRADYETILRSEEPFKSRYEAVFQKNA